MRRLLFLMALALTLASCLHVSMTGSGPVLSVPIDTPPPRHSDGGAEL